MKTNVKFSPKNLFRYFIIALIAANVIAVIFAFFFMKKNVYEAFWPNMSGDSLSPALGKSGIENINLKQFDDIIAAAEGKSAPRSITDINNIFD